MVPTDPQRQRIVPAVLLAVAVLASINWMINPEQAWRWLRVMLLLPALWLGITLWRRLALASHRRRGVDDEAAISRYSGTVIALIVLPVGLWQIVMLTLELWVALGGQRTDVDVERRILGLAASAVFVVIGNTLPKILTPFSMLPRERAQLVTIARRFVGTSLVVFGIVTAIAFVSAPLPFARNLMQWAAGGAVLAVLGAILWMNLAPARRQG